MNTYIVRTKFVFRGYFEVMATNAKEAKKIVDDNCHLVLGGSVHSFEDEILDWDFETHPDKRIGKINKK